MGFKNTKSINDAINEGRSTYTTFRKVPAIASTGGSWIDLSIATGNPRPNYYIGDNLTSCLLNSSYGLYHGGNVSPSTKHLFKIVITALNAGFAPGMQILCDYLLYYPLIDMDNTEPQEFINSISLPRYSDGIGVQMFLVATNPYIGGATFNIKYTNSSGVSNRVSISTISNPNTTIATLINTGLAATTSAPFIALAQNDIGVRSIQSIQFDAPNGGLAALVLVKPIATLMLRETTASAEFDFTYMKPSLPRIYDGAYLNFISMSNATAAAQLLQGEITTIWN